MKYASGEVFVGIFQNNTRHGPGLLFCFLEFFHECIYLSISCYVFFWFVRLLAYLLYCDYLFICLLVFVFLLLLFVCSFFDYLQSFSVLF